jgi:hypothetical protein
MKNYSKILLGLLVLVIFSLSSCKKDPQAGTVKVQFNYTFGSSMIPFEVGTTYYHPRTQDTLTFSILKFYVSNIKLKKVDGSLYEVPNSYHLVCASCPGASTIVLNDVPGGEYVGFEYTLGVDSAKIASGDQTGDLAPGEGMYWNSTDGYIMIKAEGTSPMSANGAFTIHLGGYTSPNSIVTPKQTDFFGENLMVDNNSTILKLEANPARLWHSTDGVGTMNTIDSISATSKTMGKDFFDYIGYKGMEAE